MTIFGTMQNLSFQHLVRATVFLIFSICFVYVLIIGQQILVPLVISFFLAVLLLPLNRFLEKFRFPRSLAAISSLLIVSVALAALITLFGSQLKSFAQDLDRISERLNELKSDLPPFIEEMVDGVSLSDMFAYLEQNVGEIFQGLAGFVSSFTFIIVVPVYIVLILIYRDLFRNFILRVFDNMSQENEGSDRKGGKTVREVLPKIQEIVQKYVVGMFYVICVLFVLNSIALLSLGIEHALLFAAFAAALNVIPFVGPLLGSLFPILFALVTKDSLFYPVAVLASFLLIQSLEGNLITPNIVGRNVSLNPLITLVTLFFGAAVWGVVGMILFIPLTAVLKEIIGNIEGLEPYAYLMGPGDKPTPEKPGIWDRMAEKAKNLFSRKS